MQKQTFNKTIEAIIGNEFSPKVVPLIDNAKKSIKIIVFDWRNYQTDLGSAVFKLNQALIASADRGVDVRVIISAKNSNSKWLKDFFNVREVYTKKLIHSKMIIVDDEVLILGSHNLTFSGLELNQELSIIVSGKVEIYKFVDFFNNIYG